MTSLSPTWAERADLDRLAGQLAGHADRAGALDLSYRVVDSPHGALLLAASAAGVVRVAFAVEDHNRVLDQLATLYGVRIVRGGARLDEAVSQLEQYFAGTRTRFTVPVDLNVRGGFRRSVLEHLRTVPYGATERYAQVAVATDRPRAVRAVGTACATNPVPILIPCHRVVRSDGTIGSYLGGTAVKRALLEFERAHS